MNICWVILISCGFPYVWLQCDGCIRNAFVFESSMLKYVRGIDDSFSPLSYGFPKGKQNVYAHTCGYMCTGTYIHHRHLHPHIGRE